MFLKASFRHDRTFTDSTMYLQDGWHLTPVGWHFAVEVLISPDSLMSPNKSSKSGNFKHGFSVCIQEVVFCILDSCDNADFIIWFGGCGESWQLLSN